jgi:hypothetical protein
MLSFLRRKPPLQDEDAAALRKLRDDDASGALKKYFGDYFYLVDELTGEPIKGKGYPIEITKPDEQVSKLFPVMQMGMHAMSAYQGVAGVARMFGYPTRLEDVSGKVENLEGRLELLEAAKTGPEAAKTEPAKTGCNCVVA